MPMALPLLAAAGSIYAATTATSMIVAGMLFAGGAMTAIGAINGDKKLSQFGGLLSLAGGVAGIASGAWQGASQSIAQESTTWSQADKLAETASLAGAETGAAGVAADAAAAVAPGAAPVDVSSASADWSMDGYPTAGQAPPGQVAPVASAQPPSVVAPQQPAVQAPAAPAPTGVEAPAQPTATSAPAPQQSYTTRPLAEKVADVAPKAGGNPVSEFFDWTAKNPRAAQAGSGLLQAGLGYYGQQDAVKTSIRLNEEAQARARERMNASVKGLQMPVYQRKGG